jgi:hypothetical protein
VPSPTAKALHEGSHHHHHHHHHGGGGGGGAHDHTGVKGNAYNFASSPQHASGFDLIGGQLQTLKCTRTRAEEPLGCVEGSFNWFASLCELGEHLGGAPALSNALLEFTSGWPIGVRLAERCAGQRHFLGFADGADDNHRNPYLLRQLMGFCMFHGCEEVELLGEADLASRGVATRRVGAANVTLFVE